MRTYLKNNRRCDSSDRAPASQVGGAELKAREREVPRVNPEVNPDVNSGLWCQCSSLVTTNVPSAGGGGRLTAGTFCVFV
jgi:hypothetical protein